MDPVRGQLRKVPSMIGKQLLSSVKGLVEHLCFTAPMNCLMESGREFQQAGARAKKALAPVTDSQTSFGLGTTSKLLSEECNMSLCTNCNHLLAIPLLKVACLALTKGQDSSVIGLAS